MEGTREGASEGKVAVTNTFPPFEMASLFPGQPYAKFNPFEEIEIDVPQFSEL